jgi:GTP-binding protein
MAEEKLDAAARVKLAEFTGSAAESSGFPKDGLPQIAVFGRSNVGKSSLLNSLMNRKNLVKTSSTPGKTRLLNFFRVDNRFYFVDVPGFGYAKVGGDVKKQMESVIRGYVLSEKACCGILYLVDSRLSDSPIDVEALNWLSETGRPLLVLATKTDKLVKVDLKKALIAIQKTHELDLEPLPVSSLKRQGFDAVWEQIDLLLSGVSVSQAPITSL